MRYSYSIHIEWVSGKKQQVNLPRGQFLDLRDLEDIFSHTFVHKNLRLNFRMAVRVMFERDRVKKGDSSDD